MNPLQSFCASLEIRCRGNYSTRTVGRLALLMFVIGYGDVIIFPHYIIKYGIKYLVPYLTIYFLLGVPLFALEVIIGQFQNLGPILAFYNLAPILRGVGWGMAISSMICTIYFNLYISICLVLFVRSTLVHWDVMQKEEVAAPLESFMNSENPFMPVKEADLFIGYIVAWALVISCTMREIQRSTKVIVFCNAIPCYLLLVSIGLKFSEHAAQATDGDSIMKTLLKRDLDMLDIDIWTVAVKHVVFDLGLGFGVLTTLASYNRPSANCIGDAFLIPLMGLCFGFGCLYVVYDGHYEVHNNQIDLPLLRILGSYSKSISMTVASTIYLMSFIKGIGSHMTKMQTLLTAVFDQFPNLRKKYHARVVSFLGFLLMLPGLFLCMIPGIFKEFVNASLALHLFMALVLACAAPFASMQYSFMKDELKLKSCRCVDWYLRSCWCFFTPVILVSAIVVCAVEGEFYNPSTLLIAVVLVIIFSISAIQIRPTKMKELLKPTKEFRRHNDSLSNFPLPKVMYDIYEELIKALQINTEYDNPTRIANDTISQNTRLALNV